jgi:hypothetical protein
MLKNLEKYKTVLKPREEKTTHGNTFTTDQIYDNIVHTNNLYNQKMNKTTKQSSIEYLSSQEFENFVENDINTIKMSSWKQMPFSVKFSLCKNYINADEHLSITDKNEYINNLSITNIDSIVEYDKQNTCIKKMYYNLIM